MSNDSVSACEGVLYDSGSGQIFGHYDHSEDYTFTICAEGSGGITMVFTSFCTEVDFDSLRIFEGPDTLSPQLGPTYHRHKFSRNGSLSIRMPDTAFSLG